MNNLAEKYLRPSQIPTKACNGCGIGMIENWLLQAIDELEYKQEDIIFGTGIGCVGRQTFGTWAGDNFGGTHGRSLAIATGLKMAQPDKKIVIIVGDGDAAARPPQTISVRSFVTPSSLQGLREFVWVA